MKTISETLDVARSNLIERVRKEGLRRSRYRTAANGDPLPLIREIVDARPAYATAARRRF